MSKVLGLGTDLLKVSRIASIVTRDGIESNLTKRFAQRVLHPKHELPIFIDYLKVNNTDAIVKLLSGRWCVKEAIFKSLRSSEQRSFKMKEWYKYNTTEGLPQIKNESYYIQYPNEEFLVSISHDSDLVISSVLRQER